MIWLVWWAMIHQVKIIPIHYFYIHPSEFLSRSPSPRVLCLSLSRAILSRPKQSILGKSFFALLLQKRTSECLKKTSALLTGWDTTVLLLFPFCRANHLHSSEIEQTGQRKCQQLGVTLQHFTIINSEEAWTVEYPYWMSPCLCFSNSRSSFTCSHRISVCEIDYLISSASRREKWLPPNMNDSVACNCWLFHIDTTDDSGCRARRTKEKNLYSN